jgi:hypothetical protein
MATQNLQIQDFGIGMDSADPFQSPVFTGMDDKGIGQELVVVGRYSIISPTVDAGAGTDTMSISLIVPLAISNSGSGEERFFPLEKIIPQQTIFIADEGIGSDESSSLSGVFHLDAADMGVGGEYLNLGAALLPELRDPLANEVAGAINLILNPSLEYGSIGTRGWTTDAGGILTRVEGDAWVGTWFGDVAIAGGSVIDIWTKIKSISGLRLNGVHWWVGSASIKGDVTEVKLRVVITYTDATTLNSSDTILVPTAGWQRIQTDPILQDQTKMIDSMELWVGAQRSAGATSIQLDGTQVEEAKTGGATPFVDGDQGEGHHWYGTEGYSISYREPMP